MANWSGLKDAQIFGKGSYLNPGRFTLKIINCLTKNTIKSGEGFIVEFDVIESTDTTNHPLGSKATWFQGMNNLPVAHGAIKEFIAAIYGYSLGRSESKDAFDREMNSKLEELATAATDGRNFLAGQLVKVQTDLVKTQKGNDFTRHSWYPAVDRK